MLERNLDAENDPRPDTDVSLADWMFTDPVLTAGAPIRAVHFTELREAIDVVRDWCGLAFARWTDPVLIPRRTPVRALHLTELRAALTEAYAACGRRSVPTYTDVVRADTPIRAVHVTELRDAVNLILASPAELVLEFPRASEGSLAPGDTFTFSVTVRNIGAGPSQPAPLHYYMESSGSTVRSLQGRDVVPALPPSGVSSHSITLTAPSVEDPRFRACVRYDPGPFDGPVETCSDVVEIAIVRPAADCLTDLGVVTLGTMVRREGEWTPGCDSANRAPSYARYYTFTLTRLATVTIDLMSGVDNYLFLLEGSGADGAVLALDDDSSGAGDAQIRFQDLSPGRYTIEATTFWSGRTGDFLLELKVSGEPELVLESPRVSESTVMPGDTFTFSVTVHNIGTGPSEEVPLRYYRELPHSITGTLQGRDVVPVLPPSGRSSHSIVLTAPRFENPRYYACVAYDPPNPFVGLTEVCSDAVEVTVIVPPPPPPADCVTDLGTLTGPVFPRGAWTERCRSVNRRGGYARYYTFTLSEAATVRVGLLPLGLTRTYLFLLEGSGTDGAVLASAASGLNRPQIGDRRLGPGTYTVEAATSSVSGAGPLLLEIRVEATTDCVTNLGGVGIGTVVREGEWSGRCESANRAGSYARYYTFTLSQQAWVDIDLSSNVDTYLLLLEGSGTDGTVLARNDDGGSGGTDSRIGNQGLSAGTYTIEATTYRRSTTGDFRLELEVSEVTSPVGGRGGPGVSRRVPDVTYRGNPANKEIGIVDIGTGRRVGDSVTIEFGARDHACEDGDRVEIQVFDGSSWSTVFSGEVFNRWQTGTFSATVGYHYTVIAIALNGTGFKGACSHQDANTGELRVSYGGRDRTTRWRAPGGSASVGVINVTP